MADSLNNINPRDLADVKDSLIIQDQTTSPLTTNIYETASFIDSLKSKYFDGIPKDTLSMGIFGFISEMGNNILENFFSSELFLIINTKSIKTLSTSWKREKCSKKS